MVFASDDTDASGSSGRTGSGGRGCSCGKDGTIKGDSGVKGNSRSCGESDSHGTSGTESAGSLSGLEEPRELDPEEVGESTVLPTSTSSARVDSGGEESA